MVMALIAAISAGFLAGCSGSGGDDSPKPDDDDTRLGQTEILQLQAAPDCDLGQLLTAER
jgi:uncharacterized lipoprotein